MTAPIDTVTGYAFIGMRVDLVSLAVILGREFWIRAKSKQIERC